MFLSNSGISQNSLSPTFCFSPSLPPSLHPLLWWSFFSSSLSPCPIPFSSHHSSLSVISGCPFFHMQTNSFNMAGARTMKSSSTSHLSCQKWNAGHYSGKGTDLPRLYQMSIPGLSSCGWGGKNDSLSFNQILLRLRLLRREKLPLNWENYLDLLGVVSVRKRKKNYRWCFTRYSGLYRNWRRQR